MTRFVLHENTETALVCLPPGTKALFAIEFAGLLTGVHPSLLRRFHDEGLLAAIEGETPGELYVDAGGLATIRRLQHFRRNLGVPLRALRMLCELQEAAERGHVRLPFLQTRFFEGGPGGNPGN